MTNKRREKYGKRRQQTTSLSTKTSKKFVEKRIWFDKTRTNCVELASWSSGLKSDESVCMNNFRHSSRMDSVINLWFCVWKASLGRCECFGVNNQENVDRTISVNRVLEEQGNESLEASSQCWTCQLRVYFCLDDFACLEVSSEGISETADSYEEFKP